MSIINDALKKAGQPIISEKSESRSEIKPVVHIERRKNTPNWGPLFLVAVVFLITGPIVAPIFFNNPSSKIISSPSEISVAANLGSSQKGQYSVEEIPLSRPMSPPMLGTKSAHPATQFRLSGVVYSEAGSYCLINGKVIKQGEEVSGAVLEKVTPKEVVLNYKGERITLPVED